MKKLINLLETNVTVSSLGLSNTTTDTDTSNDLISPTLLNDINTAAKNANVNVKITTAVSGHRETTTSGNPSRHIPGNAVDIAMINNKAVSTANRADADAFVAQLKNMGYTTNGEVSYTETPKVVLWQVPQHYDHVHISNTTDVESSVGDSVTPSTAVAAAKNKQMDDFDAAAKRMNQSFVEPGISAFTGKSPEVAAESISSKEKKLINEISKIKNLLK